MMSAPVTLDCSQKFIADLLDRNGWTLTLRSVPGRRFRAVVLGSGPVEEIASKVDDDFGAAVVGAIALAIETQAPLLQERSA